MSLLLLFNPQQSKTNPGLGLLLRPGPAPFAAQSNVAARAPTPAIASSIVFLFGTSAGMAKGYAVTLAATGLAGRATGQAKVSPLLSATAAMQAKAATMSKGRATQGDTASLSGRAAGMAKSRAAGAVKAALQGKATGQGKGRAAQGDKASLSGRAAGMAKGRGVLSGTTPGTGTKQPTLFIANTGRFLGRKGN